MGADPPPHPFSLLSDRARSLLESMRFTAPTPPQILAIPKVQAGLDVLLIAPTGSGKTEAVLLPILDRLAHAERNGIGLLYVTPLRALNRDMQGRLEGMCHGLGLTVETRHGDTPQRDRRRQSAKPPDVLITTPESLQAILPGAVMRRHLRHVQHVIVDEVHQLVRDRRGVQLMVALERLREITTKPFQRIGLSATVGDPSIVARFLGGSRPLEILEAPVEKAMEFRVEWPKPNDEDFETARDLYVSPEAAASMNLMRDLIEEHRSTLVFVNSRNVAELVGHRLSMIAQDVGVHHGWLPRVERERVEREFKDGRLRGLVCTSTLELGINIGSVDLALQYMSPRQVTSLIQRVGRAGHSLDRVSKGVVVTVSSDDTAETVAAIEAARARSLEPLRVHRHARDVLAHQIVGCVLDAGGRTSVETIQDIVIRAEPYADLPQDAFDRVLEFLVSLRLLRKQDEELAVTSRTRRYYFENLSTIRDERRYVAIDLATQQPVGILGEEFMMVRARQGYNFIVRGRTWKIQKIGEDGTIYVTAVTDPTAALPGWDGEMIPVHFPLALRTSRLRREIDERLDRASPDVVAAELERAWPVNRTGVKRLVDEIVEHRNTGAPVPSDRLILVEGFDRFLIVHAGFGEIVNETLGDLLEELLARKALVRFWWATAHRILLELVVDTKDLDLKEIANDLFGIDEVELERSLNILTEEHLPIGYYMKFIAERMGAMKRGLMVAADEFNSIELRFRKTPIREEGLREAMLLHTDYDAVREVFRKIGTGEIRVETFKSIDRPTPLGYHILRRFVEAPELFSPEAEREANLERMRLALNAESVNLLCFQCTTFHEAQRISGLSEKPVCPKCGSNLLGVLSWSAWAVRDALGKKMMKLDLSEDEQKVLARVRQTADLVAVYGRKAVVAQSVYGIGPQTASKILSKMHADENAFYEDLFEAKLRYITTRPYWDERNRGGPATKTLYT